jgi:hypothetical protein
MKYQNREKKPIYDHQYNSVPEWIGNLKTEQKQLHILQIPFIALQEV